MTPTALPIGMINRRYDLESAVFQAYKKSRDAEEPHRWHIGASDVAHECPRHLWYVWRWAFSPKFDGRILRLFQRGHRMEEHFANDLKAAGCVIYTHDYDGKQFEYGTLWNHCKVHLDSLALVPQKDGKTLFMIIEMKTMSEKRFAKLEKLGVKDAHPDYYRQMQTQLLVARKSCEPIDKIPDRPVEPSYKPPNIKHRKLDGVIFFAENKNTDDIYIEQVFPDEHLQNEIEVLLNQLIDPTKPAPPPLDCSTSSPPCKWCDFKSICRDNEYHQIEKNCRTCFFGNPIARGTQKLQSFLDGQWECSLGNDFGKVCKHWSMRKDF